MADTTIKLSGTYDSIEAYRILEEMREMSADYEEIKEEAEAAVTTATVAATTAQGHANNASTYADNAQTYAGNANTSAGAAAGYASDASTAATNAATSETNASNSASAAASSESNASTSETNAAASATAAAASAAEAAATLDSYLPLSGGTMTGTIINDSTNFVSRPNDTGELILFSGTVGNAYPAIVLRGKNRTSEAGSLFVRVQDSSASKILLAKPDGALTWDRNKITVNSNIEDVTVTAVPTSVSNIGSYNNAYRCGCVVTIGFNFQIKAGVASGAVLFSGLPKPKKNIGVAFAGGSLSQKCYIQTTGELKLDGAGPSAITWLSGCVTYITTD